VAITAPTTTGDFAGFLTREQSAPIFERADRMSVVQSLVREVPLGATGVAVPVVSGRLQAGWVAEGGTKPASQGALSLKNIDPKKLAVIAVVSAEVVRANPGNYMNLIREQVAEAFALAFDAAALHGTATPFTTYIGQTTKSTETGAHPPEDGGVHADIVEGLRLLVNDRDENGRRYRLTGFALDDVVEPEMLDSTDANGRPIYMDTPLSDTTAAATPGRLIGRPSYMREGVADPEGATVAFGGDWSQAAWGSVGGISYDVSTEAAVTIDGSLVSLWENNLVAVRAEAEYGWLVNDPEAFVEYTLAGS